MTRCPAPVFASLLSASLATTVLLASCAGYNAHEEGRRLMMDGQTDRALAKMAQAVREAPDNEDYRRSYERERIAVVGGILSVADENRMGGRLGVAEAGYRRALALDPDNARAKAGLTLIVERQRQDAAVQAARADLDAGALNDAQTKLRAVLAADPDRTEVRDLLQQIQERQAKAAAAQQPSALKSPFNKPITLEFRDATLKSVFEVMSRTSGINFVFDRDVRADTKINIFVRNSTLEDVIKLILVTNQLDRKMLNDNSVLVYPNTPAKQKEYRELVVRTFYLANGDVKQAVNLVKGMVKTQDVFIDEKLNLMVVKDTPEAMGVVDKLVRAFDLAEPEVMLEMSVLELDSTEMQNLGIQYPTQINVGDPTGLSNPTTGAGSNFVFGTGQTLKAFVVNPPIVANLMAQDTGTKVLANPRIRIKNREKAKVLIGSKLPVVTTTSTANVGVSSSVSYLDVGLKLDLEPTIYLRDGVAMKVGLEVSNVISQVNIQGTLAYTIGTRNTATVLQIKDGETQMLAGLIQDVDQRTFNKIPGLGDIPILRQLFGSTNDNRNKNEIVLLITPRIVRSVNWPLYAVADTPVGTDMAIGSSPLRIQQTAAGSLALAPSQGAGGPPRSLPQEGPATIPGGSPPAGVPLPAPPGGQPGQPGPTAGAAPPEAAQPVPGLLMAAPLAARSGNEVLVSIGLPPGTPAVSARLDLGYDPTLLEPVGAAVSEPGRLPLKVDGSVSVRFKVLGQQGTRAQVRAENVVGVDSNGASTPMLPPGPVDIAITP